MSLKGKVMQEATRFGLEGPIRRAQKVRAAARARRQPWIRRNDRDERHMRVALATALSPDSNTVDVGAASGAILSELVRLAPRGKHVAFEPREEAARALAKRFPSVDVRQAAASDTDGPADFTLVTNLPTLSGFAPRAWPWEAVETRVTTVRSERLDDVVKHEIAVLKIDVEGAEAACLRGAKETLARCQPLVLIEHGATIPGDPEDPDHAEVWELLDDAGLRVYDSDGNGPFSLQDFAAASASGQMWQFFARP